MGWWKKKRWSINLFSSRWIGSAIRQSDVGKCGAFFLIVVSSIQFSCFKIEGLHVWHLCSLRYSYISIREWVAHLNDPKIDRSRLRNSAKFYEIGFSPLQLFMSTISPIVKSVFALADWKLDSGWWSILERMRDEWISRWMRAFPIDTHVEYVTVTTKGKIAENGDGEYRVVYNSYVVCRTVGSSIIFLILEDILLQQILLFMIFTTYIFSNILNTVGNLIN